MIEGVTKTLQILEAVRRFGCLTVAVLAEQPGWNKASASRYLTAMNNEGWIEKVNDKGYPKYVFGRKVRELFEDWKI